MFQDIVERMTNKHTALAPFTTKIKVVAPSKMKVLGVDWRIYLVSKFSAGVDLDLRVRCTWLLHRPHYRLFFEPAVLRATFQSNSCFEINHSSCCTRTVLPCLLQKKKEIKKIKGRDDESTNDLDFVFIFILATMELGPNG